MVTAVKKMIGKTSAGCTVGTNEKNLLLRFSCGYFRYWEIDLPSLGVKIPFFG